jgi:hypothetical protein
MAGLTLLGMRREGKRNNWHYTADTNPNNKLIEIYEMKVKVKIDEVWGE